MRIIIHDSEMMVDIEEVGSSIIIQAKKHGTDPATLRTSIGGWREYVRFEQLHLDALAIMAGIRPQLDEWAKRKPPAS